MASLASVVEEAIRARWCTKVACTTCGASSYRNALATARKEDPTGFDEALVSWPFEGWVRFEDRRGAVFHALNALGSSNAVSRVLERWMTRPETPTWLLDAVLFDIVRAGLAQAAVQEAWLQRALDAARVTRDVSLVESLLYTLGGAARQHISLLGLAEGLAASEPRVARALRHVGLMAGA
jgi:hypothetical protein